MKKNIYLFIIALSSLLTSCENVLDKEPLDIISDGQVWEDEALVEAYLAEVYAQTYVFHNVHVDNKWDNLWNGDAGPGAMVINEVSDEAASSWFDVGYSYKLGGLTVQGGLLEWWEQAYIVIRKTNVLIDQMSDSPLEESLRRQFIAEARFLRAFSYFELVKRYGGVPIISEIQSPSLPEEELYLKRNKEQEVYDFVLSEMDAISVDLPQSGDIGIATKYAAMALKSRAALYAGSIAKYGILDLEGVVGIPSSEANKYYQKSIEAANIITLGGFSLYNENADKVANFRELFMDGDNNEKIFVRRHNPENSMGGEALGTGWAYDFFQSPPPNGWNAGNQDAPYLEMAEEFELIDGTSGALDRDAIQLGTWTMDQLWANKDPRFFATIYTQGTPWKGSNLEMHTGLRIPDGTIIDAGSYEDVLAKGENAWKRGISGFGVLKYLDEQYDTSAGALTGQWAQTETDWIVFRYAEILLNYAEASLELGSSGDALNAVNQIRDRAGIAALGSIDLEKIQHERKVELAFEGHRYWDLRRWRKAANALSINQSALRYVLDYNTRDYVLQVINDFDGVVNPPLFFEKNYYFPITPRRIGINPNLVENPGY